MADMVTVGQKAISRHCQAAQQGYYRFDGIFTFGAGSTTGTVTISDVTISNFINAQATYASTITSDPALFVTRSGQVLTIARNSAVTSAPNVALSAIFQ